MISEVELRRKAARWQVDPMVIDLDYSLSWFLAGFFSTGGVAKKLRFKGGTCLRKCYFANHRFPAGCFAIRRARVCGDHIRNH